MHLVDVLLRHRGELVGGTANYYRRVKVCCNCYLVYSTLDRARELFEAENKARLEADRIKSRASWAAEVRAQALLQATDDAEVNAIEMQTSVARRT